MAPTMTASVRLKSRTSPVTLEAARQWAKDLVFELDRPLAVLDLETTGVWVETDRIVELSMLVIDATEMGQFDTLVNPQVPIPAEATAVHQITNAMVQDAPTFAQIAPRVTELLKGADLCGFNLRRFDKRMLQAELKRVGSTLDLDACRVIDPYLIFAHREPRDLSAAVKFFCDTEPLAAHEAMGDVADAIRVLAAQQRKYADLPTTVAELHALCQQRDPSWLDAEGKIVWRDGEARIAFGKNQGKPLRDLVARDRSFLDWMLAKDFPADTKAILRAALTGKYPTAPPPPTAEQQPF